MTFHKYSSKIAMEEKEAKEKPREKLYNPKHEMMFML